MFWGALSSRGRLDLVQYETYINLDKYIELVKNNIILFIRNKYDNLCLFQQDNTPIHVLRKTKTLMFEAGMAVMKWPACSPDLNPMENVRSYLSRKVYQHGQQYSSAEDLRTVIHLECNLIPESYFDKLIESMNVRSAAVLESKGRKIEY